MDKLTHKTLATSPHDLTYSYYLSPNFSTSIESSVPTLVFAHGYPDDAHMWADAVPHLLQLPYPFILLDILGLGGSSKPTDPSLYNYRKQSNSIAQILDHENVPNNVIPVGHDWGSAISQRFYLYNRHRCVGLCLISLAYQIPSTEPFILPEANKATAKRFGYPQWEYFNFFTAPDAAKLMNDNPDRFYACNHGNYPSPNPEEKGRDIWMREIFCTPNAMRDYITATNKYENYTVPLKPYAERSDVKKRIIDRLKRDGFEAPVCYYTSLTENTMLEDERDLCARPNEEGRRIDVPVLFIGQTGDWVCRTDLMSDAKEEGLVEDVEEKVVQAGHWVLYEKPEEVAGLLADWLKRRFPVSS